MSQPLKTDRPPLVFIDVDGVINALGNSHGALPANRADRYTSIEVGTGPDAVTVRYRPDVVARLRHLSERGLADFHWLTSWRHHAREDLAPAIGLPDWPAIPHPIDIGGDADTVAAHQWDPNRRWWKHQAVLDATEGGHRFAWLDDDLDGGTRGTLRQVRPQTHLLITPPTSLALTNQLLRQLEHYCDLDSDHDALHP